MAVGEDRSQISSDEPANDDRGEDVELHLVEEACAAPFLDKAMCVVPATIRALALLVDEDVRGAIGRDL